VANDRAGVIEQLNEGAQASVFAARRKDGRPIWQANHELAIKLYKSGARQEAEVVREQFASLERLHARLNGSSSDGWKVCVPAPVYRCEEPLALVMTLVPGRSLNACLETIDGVPGEALEPIARAVVAALEQCWSSDEQAHGDLNFDNILCDVPGQSLSFVDPGVIESDAHCAGVSRKWYPASRDLAYLLYDSGVTVRRTFGQRGARQRQQGLVERVLRVFLLKVGPGQDRQDLLDEIQACTRAHLKRLRMSGSPRGLWHVLLRRIAARRIDGILARLRADVGVGGTVP
jgi:hypothetical protein